MDCGQMQLLSEMCPDLRSVNLYVDEDTGSPIEPLGTLCRLAELKLLACNFYSDGVDELLRRRGEGLQMLHLEYVDQLDMEALCFIAENCRYSIVALKWYLPKLYRCPFT